MNEARLVDALSRYREILRRETSFLTREVRLRNLATTAGKISYVDSQSNSKPPLSIQKISELSVLKESSEFKVSLPYLVSKPEEALDFLLHALLLLRYRIQSLSSIMREFNIPISSQKVKSLLMMSRALVWISRHIMRSDATNSCEDKSGIFSYDKHRLGWESLWGSGSPNFGFFNDITTLSPMQFTCSTPAIVPHSATTLPALQIYSIQIVDLNANLDWPLYVWGVVAARDTVDRNRNVLFYRTWANCQKLTEDNPFLCLTGPSRAIVAAEDVTFEVELQLKYGSEFQHTAVLACDYRYHSACDDTPKIARGCCTAKLTLEQLATVIQATIVGVHIEGGWQPFKHGCQVVCSSFPAAEVTGISTRREIILLDCRGGKIPVGSDGYISLSRNVVLVEPQGRLKVAIRDLGSGIEGHVTFHVKYCQTSELATFVGNCKVKVVVAWSLLLMNKENLMLEGYVPL